ncbi:MAG: UDP-N-acetylmuramate dehydrogenase [Puniceicoccales bacterium]|jgi:UDP-N-acetylenolpyruvoylglucosamine reductase|nr:UDP-N-acetylmuramate dehydrogenase [Puniceicoccales bacterium]
MKTAAPPAAAQTPAAAKPPVAVIDFGSNTLKAIVAAGDLPLRTLAKMSDNTRLGPNSGEPADALSPRAMREGVAAAVRLAAFVRSHGAERVRAVATSMVRDAPNGPEFCEAVWQQTGLRLEVLSGADEARGIAAGVATDPVFADAPALRIADLGGGSLEYIVTAGGVPRMAESRPLGAVRLTRRFVPDPAAPIPAAALDAVAQHVREVMAELVDANDPALRGAPFAGCGGVFTVSRLLLAEERGIPPPADNADNAVVTAPAAALFGDSFLPVSDLLRLRDTLAALPLERRIRLPVLLPNRADIFPVALTILLELARLAGVAGFSQTTRSLRHGLAAQLAATAVAAQLAAPAPPAPAAWMLGVCGMGMGPLAIYLRGEGWEVSGWDDAPAQPMRDCLLDAGVTFSRTFDTARPPALAGFSSAVKNGHPLRTLADAHGVRLVRRGELLAECARGKKFIAVCGSHGKTTTCGMLAQALLAAGADIGYVLGGLYRDPLLPPARNGKSPWLAAEVDESDGTISHFSPEITVAVNLDWDHPDYYRTEADLEAVFAALFQRTTGAIFIPADSARLCRLAEAASVPVFKVGAADDAGGAAFCDFNTANARMALAVARHVAGRVGEPPLGKFSGIRRRQDTLFEGGGLRVLADYAHHPTEIAALLRHLRGNAVGRLIAVFQPHRHTRTRQYAREFASALKSADSVLLLPVYSAGEAPVEGGTASSVFEAAGGDPRFSLLSGSGELAERLAEMFPDVPDAALDAAPADAAPSTVAFIGAGDIDRMAAAFADALRWKKLATRRPFGARTTLGVGGTCAWYAEPASAEEIRSLFAAAKARSVPVFVAGRGSNLLVPDAGFAGLVIRLAAPVWRGVEVRDDGADGKRIVVGAGATLREIARRAAEAGMGGFAFLDGIPGTLGGALRMNAGAAGETIFGRVEYVTWLSPEGAVRRQPASAFDVRYRDCPTLAGGAVLSAELRGAGDIAPAEAFAEMAALAERRRAAQPAEPSAGSVFKNPAGDSAGRLIESLGLKGLRIGGAAVSEVHANFIVNKGGATAADVLALIEKIRADARAKRGVELELEIVVVGGSGG